MKRGVAGMLTSTKFRFWRETSIFNFIINLKHCFLFFEKACDKNNNNDNFLLTVEKFVFSHETSIQF